MNKQKNKQNKSKRRNKFKKGRAPSNISKNIYISLIKRRLHNKDDLSDTENYKLDFALKRKYCNCIEQVKYKYYIRSDKYNPNRKTNRKTNRKHTIIKDGNNPYAVCKSSIYTKRGFKTPINLNKKCSKLYE